MRIETEKIKEIIKVSKLILSARKKIDSLEIQINPQISQSRRNSIRNKCQTNHEFIEDMMHELHCLSVEVGIAEREEERYGEFEITSSNGWSVLKKLRREPKK